MQEPATVVLHMDSLWDHGDVHRCRVVTGGRLALHIWQVVLMRHIDATLVVTVAVHT